MFEKVVVLNELHGQSDAFCSAVKQLGCRWKLVWIALPHLIHCCAIALQSRDKLRGCGSTARLPPSSKDHIIICMMNFARCALFHKMKGLP